MQYSVLCNIASVCNIDLLGLLGPVYMEVSYPVDRVTRFAG